LLANVRYYTHSITHFTSTTNKKETDVVSRTCQARVQEAWSLNPRPAKSYSALQTVITSTSTTPK